MRLTILRKLIDNIRCQRGQVVVVAVGVMALSLGAIMISVDAGWWLRDKRDAQNDADAIALAAAQELPDRTAAELRGEDWAVANDVDPSTEMAPPDCADDVPHVLQGNFCFIDQNSDGDADKVRVKVSRPSNSFIAEALGVTSPTLNPPAAASKLYGVAACILPWGILAGEDPPPPEDFYGLDPTNLYTFQDDNADIPGNYGSVSIYGTGGDVYKESIRTPGCLDEDDIKNNACTTDAVVGEEETLDDCPPKPGKMGNPTDQALDQRYQGVLATPGICDPVDYLDAQGKANESPCNERAVPLAIIDAFPNGSKPITIYGIAIFYIAGWSFPADPDKGFVWGYLVTDIPVTPAWEVEWDVSENPFAPVGFFLVE